MTSDVSFVSPVTDASGAPHTLASPAGRNRMPPSTEDSRAASQRYYQGMVQARRQIIVPLVLLTLVFFFTQQVLTNFTTALDGMAFSGMSWAYIYAFAQFFFVIILTTIYRSRMQRVETELGRLLPTAAAEAGEVHR